MNGRHSQPRTSLRIETTDFADHRPSEDILCTDESYRELYERSGLEVLASYRPLGKPEEPYPWVNETTIAPWVIYVLVSRLRKKSLAGYVLSSAAEAALQTRVVIKA